MDPHYLRLRRRRRLVRAFAVCLFFGLLSLPVLYLVRSEIRSTVAMAYRYARSQAETPPTKAPAAAQATPAKPAPAANPPSAPAPIAVAQAQPAPQRAPAPRHLAAKLGETTFRIPEGYVEGNADLGSNKNPLILLRALLPDLRPRAEGRGNCAPKQPACPDFAIVKLRPARSGLERQFTKRYKTGPSQIALIPGIHGLRQIPPQKARPGDGRQYLAQPAGRWVWITCREFGQPDPKRPRRGICQLAFDTVDGLAVTVRFDKGKLRDWSAIHAKAAEFIAGLKG